ncbi:hypothetical protein FRC12_024694 [Ceratobasidium sp. 428]|nr:hypothetical protein FRC12_024694 [Ceratobasidium sp. 428]
MAPVTSELVSVLVSLNTKYDSWISATVDTTENLQISAGPVDVLSDIWAWVVNVFVSIGLFFTSMVPGLENIGEHLSKYWADMSEFLLQPHIRNLLIIWFIVFWVVLFIPLILGFGPAGILAGSLAAWFQSAVYGAFTPAGGVFAILTSVGMMGMACPPAVLLAVAIASAVTGIVWGTQG